MAKNFIKKPTRSVLRKEPVPVPIPKINMISVKDAKRQAAETPSRKSAADDLFRGTQPSLWKFWEHGVTSSFLNAFLTCREQSRLSYVEGYKSRHVPLAFEFGTCCHWVLEQAYGEGFVQLKKAPAKGWVEQTIKAYELKWLTETTAPSSAQLKQQELVYGLAEAILPTYFTRWAGDFTGKYSPANPTVAPARWDSLEIVFCHEYEYPDGRKTFLRGRRDGVFIDKKGEIWVFDTKCRSVINHEDACETLPVDIQQMFYLYVTYLERKKAKLTPVFPSGTVMNIVRRPGHRRGAAEQFQDFLQRVAKDVANPRKYDHNLVRYQMRVMKDELLLWKEKTLDPLMMDVRMWWEGTAPHYMNPNALISKYGRCELFQPIVNEDFSGCYRRDFAFSELAEV